MTVVVEEPGRIRMRLTAEELLELGLTYESLDYADGQTRKVLSTLLRLAAARKGFQLLPGRMLIEVFPARSGGCTIYFTIFEQEKAKRRLQPANGQRALQFTFCDTNALLDAAGILYAGTSAPPADARLYLADGKYQLLLYASAGLSQLRLLAGEYADGVTDDPVAIARTKEHGKLLSEDAVFDIGRLTAADERPSV